jgi:hypothetical protein
VQPGHRDFFFFFFFKFPGESSIPKPFQLLSHLILNGSPVRKAGIWIDHILLAAKQEQKLRFA